jgi:PIN domain nuclease of toxin-antitoxin system
VRGLFPAPLHANPFDRFDRMLLAQALSEGLMLVTKDADMSRYAVECIWWRFASGSDTHSG